MLVSTRRCGVVGLGSLGLVSKCCTGSVLIPSVTGTRWTSGSAVGTVLPRTLAS